METSYCIFAINQHLNAVDADYIDEMFALPELILVPNAPSGIIGVIDLRGEVLPVVDFRLNIEGQSLHYQLTDSVIVLKQADLRIGLIVNTVQTIRDLSVKGMMTNLTEHQDWINPEVRGFFAGMTLNEQTIFILDQPQSWFSPGEIQQVIAITRFLVDDFYARYSSDEQSSDILPKANVTMAFCSDAPPQEKTIFRQRADSLRQLPDKDKSDTTSKTLIVVELDNRFVGIDATCVREFITIHQAAPIPCCPRHIIGNTNLRGEILTVIDISEPLGFSSKLPVKGTKAVVIELEHILAAVLIEDVRDALFAVKLNTIKPISSNVFATKSDHFEGTVPYKDQSMYILNLPKLLHSDELVVNEIL